MNDSTWEYAERIRQLPGDLNSGECGGKYRVAIVIDQLSVAGSEIQMLRLSQGLRAQGHYVVILVLGSIDGACESEYRRASEDGVVILHSGGGRVSRAREVVRYLRLEKFDIIYGVMSRACLLVTLAKPVLGGSRVVVAKRFMMEEVSGGRRLVRLLPQVLADGVAANSEAAANELRRSRFARRKRICVVPNALSDSAFEVVKPFPSEAAMPTIACVANLRPPKGHAMLLEAAALLEQRGKPVLLNFVGTGQQEEDLRRLAAQFRVRVRWLGRVEDPRRIIASSDIVVQASLSEGMPNAVLEAMAQGKPVVATDVGGTAEVLEGVGVLVTAGQPESLAEGIEYLLNNPIAARRLGVGARTRARSFTQAAAAQRHVDFFGRTLEGRS